MGFDKMMTELENEYVQLVFEIYPNLATVYGVPKIGYNDFTCDGISKNILKLEKLLKKVKISSRKIQKNIHLIKNLELIIFELKSISHYRYSSFYYYLMTFKSLLILLEDNNYYKNGVNNRVIESRINEFPDVIDKAIYEMQHRELSELDLLYTLSLVKRDKAFIEKKAKKHQEEYSLQSIILSVEKFLKFLIIKIKSPTNKKKFCSLGSNNLIEYVNKVTCWNISSQKIEKLYIEALNNIEVNKKENIFSVKNKENLVDCSEKILLECLQEIYSKSKSIFGENENIIERLKFIDIKSDEYMFGNFQYIGSSIDNSYLIYSSKNNIECMEQLKLKMVHEIYPGHHYMRWYFSIKNQTNIYQMIRINSYIEEGWAKYCEFFYANKLDCSEKMKQSFRNNLTLMSIIFVITIDIHFKEKQLIEIHKQLIGKCGLTKKIINSMILSLNVDVDRGLSYYIGYNYFCNFINNKKKNNNIINFKNEILKNLLI